MTRVKKMRNISFSQVLAVIIFTALITAFIFSIYKMTNTADDEWNKRTLDAVTKSVVTCYAVEGIYPPDIEYLKKHYGLIVDESKYTIHYRVHGSNMMPEIDIFLK